MSIPTVFADFLLAEDSSYLKQRSGRGGSRVLPFVRVAASSGGQASKDYLQGGKSIKSFLQLDDQNAAHFYAIGEEETPSQPQTVSDIELSWRFARGLYTYDDETVLLNTSGMGRTARHKEYFRFKRQLEKAAYIDKFKLMEAQLFAQPDGSEMESTTSGKQPQSIPVCVNEDTNSLPIGYSGDSVTTIEGIAPATKTQWQCQQLGYDITNNPLLGKMSRMFRQVKFDGLPDRPEYGNKSTMPAVVWTMLDGVQKYEDDMRGGQDTFVYVGRQDPAYPNPTIHGVPVEYAAVLDTAAIFPTDSGGAYSTYDSTAGTTNAGPRYFFCNLDDMTPVIHSEMWMKKHPLQTPYRQPSRHTVYMDTYYNIVFHNRRTQGIVYPTADVTGYLSPPTTT